MSLPGLVPVQSVVIPRSNSETRKNPFPVGIGAKQFIIKNSTHIESTKKTLVSTAVLSQSTAVSLTLTTSTEITGTTTRLTYRRSVLTVTA
jgi:hypothetical protein